MEGPFVLNLPTGVLSPQLTERLEEAIKNVRYDIRYYICIIIFAMRNTC